MSTVKEINHDSSTTIGDHYSTVTDPNSAITVTVPAALNGSTNGVNFNQDAGSSTAQLAETFTATGSIEFRWRMRFNLSQLTDIDFSFSTLVSGFVSKDSGDPSGNRIADFFITGDNNEGLEASFGYFIDTSGIGQSLDVASVSVSGELCVELALVRETADGNADGTAEWFLNGSSVQLVSGIENFNKFGGGANNMRMEFPSRSAFDGDFYYDEWIIDDDSTADLGCPALFSGYDLVLGGGQP